MNNEMQAMFRLLGANNSFMIFEYIAKHEGTRILDIGKGLGKNPGTVSSQVKNLRQAGMVETETEGSSVHCYINEIALEKLRAYIGSHIKYTADEN